MRARTGSAADPTTSSTPAPSTPAGLRGGSAPAGDLVPPRERPATRRTALRGNAEGLPDAPAAPRASGGSAGGMDLVLVDLPHGAVLHGQRVVVDVVEARVLGQLGEQDGLAGR